MDRRQFMQLGAMGLALLVVRKTVLGEENVLPGNGHAWAALSSLPPGDIRPEGWLQLYLDKQAKELAFHLPDVSWPFTKNYWAGEEEAPSWAPWEQKAYWADGALRCGLVTGNTELLARARVPIHYTLQHVDRDGYLGPVFLKTARAKDPAHDNLRWPQTVFFRALAAESEATHDRTIAYALRKHYLSDVAPDQGCCAT